jgi:hypothetical protein
MKPYLLWAGDNYYPGAGLSDYVGDFDTLEEAEAYGRRTYETGLANYPQRVYDWYEVVEHATMTRVGYA